MWSAVMPPCPPTPATCSRLSWPAATSVWGVASRPRFFPAGGIPLHPVAWRLGRLGRRKRRAPLSRAAVGSNRSGGAPPPSPRSRRGSCGPPSSALLKKVPSGRPCGPPEMGPQDPNLGPPGGPKRGVRGAQNRGFRGSSGGPGGTPRDPPKMPKKWHFFGACGARTRGGGGAPPTTLILLRNQRKPPSSRRPHARDAPSAPSRPPRAPPGPARRRPASPRARRLRPLSPKEKPL